MRAWMSLALIVSTVSFMPRSFSHSLTISPLRSTSEAGTKSAQRSRSSSASGRKRGPARSPGCLPGRRYPLRARWRPKAATSCVDGFASWFSSLLCPARPSTATCRLSALNRGFGFVVEEYTLSGSIATPSPHRAGRVRALIFDFLNHRTGQLDPSYAAIAQKAGVCVRAVATALARLRELRILNWVRRCAESWRDGRFVLAQQTNAYAVLPERPVARLPAAAGAASARTGHVGNRRPCRMPSRWRGWRPTCARHGVAFWDYLGSRLKVPGHTVVPPLAELIRCRGQPA